MTAACAARNASPSCSVQVRLPSIIFRICGNATSDLTLGSQGCCVSATANFQVRNIRRLIDASEGEARRELNQAVGRVRGVFEKLPLVPALKAAMAIHFKREAWRVVRPPLVELSEAQRRELASALDAVGA